FFEAVGDFLAFDDSKRCVGTGFSVRRQFLDPLANFVKDRSFGETLPSRDQAHGGPGILFRFFSRFEDRLRINKPVSRTSCSGCVGLIRRGLAQDWSGPPHYLGGYEALSFRQPNLQSWLTA